MSSWADLRVETERRLRAAGVDAPDAEARWMIERVSGYDGVELILGEHERATEVAVAHLDDMVARRLTGEPLQYVLGRWQFRTVDLFVDHRVLIPRPETEVVAEVALKEAERLGARRGSGDPWVVGGGFPVADLGTGSGALALTLALELVDAEVWATDASSDALAVARANLSSIGSSAARVRLAEGSWFDALPSEARGRFRIVVSNPPYVGECEVAELPDSVAAWEPRDALVSGPTGREAIDAIVDEARSWLDPDGAALIVELAPHQADAVTTRAREAGFTSVEVQKDLAGRERVLVARVG